MRTMNPERAEDRALLMDFYQLKTLSPKQFDKDTIPSTFKIDISNENLAEIPKEIVNNLLGDNSTESDEKMKTSSAKNNTSSVGKGSYVDPLGFKSNILDELIDKDILDDTRDPQIGKFMVDSKLFNPRLFLSVVHSDKSLKELLFGIKNLENDIESKKPLLQQLITNNFERTLNTKNSLDKVFNHFSTSNLSAEISDLNDALSSSSNSANQMLNPILLLLSKEKDLTNTVSFIKENRSFIDLPKKLKRYVDEDDFDSVLKEYELGFLFFQKIKSEKNVNPFFDKIWSNVKTVIEQYKQSMIDDLTNTRIDLINSNFKLQLNSKKRNFVVLLKRIVELDPASTPMKTFVKSQYENIIKDLDKGLVRIDYQDLNNTRNAVLKASGSENGNINLSVNAFKLFSQLASPSYDNEQIDSLYERLDSRMVISLWEFFQSYVETVTEGVIGNKIIKFESMVEFLAHDFVKLLSEKARQVSRKIDEKSIAEMKQFFKSMMKKICDRLTFLFESTTDDLNKALLISEKDGHSTVFPKPGLRNIDDVSTYGFVTPNSNSITTICYCVKFFKTLSNKLVSIKNQKFILNTPEVNSIVEITLTGINKNIIEGCIAAMKHDIQSAVYIDNMEPNESVEGSTRITTFSLNFYQTFVAKIHELHDGRDQTIVELIQHHLLQSVELLLKNIAQNIDKLCDSDPNRFDYYYLVSIYNIRHITTKVLPLILKSFDMNFKTKLTTKKDLEIYKISDSLESQIFVDYMKEPFANISKIINLGMADINVRSQNVLSKTSTNDIVPASPFLLSSINYINTLKSKLYSFNVRPSFVLDIQSALITKLQKKILENLSSDFTKDAQYQLSIDLMLLVTLLKKYNSKAYDHNKVETSSLEKALTKLSSKFDSASVEKSVHENLSLNYIQFNSFISD